MTSKEKAKELIDKFEKVNITFQASAFSNVETYPLNEQEAKQCALICVDEIDGVLAEINQNTDEEVSYWKEVKKEIENYGKEI